MKRRTLWLLVIPVLVLVGATAPVNSVVSICCPGTSVGCITVPVADQKNMVSFGGGVVSSNSGRFYYLYGLNQDASGTVARFTSSTDVDVMLVCTMTSNTGQRIQFGVASAIGSSGEDSATAPTNETPLGSASTTVETTFFDSGAVASVWVAAPIVLKIKANRIAYYKPGSSTQQFRILMIGRAE